MERIQSALAKARSTRDGKGLAPEKQAKKFAAQAEYWLELPEVQLDSAKLVTNRIVAHQSVAEAAAFDMMRTNLLRQMRTNGWTRVAITSPTAGCGKTTVAMNLAFSLARLADVRVLVIELDLRRPSVGQTLGITANLNFAGALAGNEPVQAQLRRWGTNLAIGMTTTPLDSPAELLSAAQTADVIDAIEDRLQPDLILFDTSPLLANGDTIAFLDQVDCALMVAAADQTTGSDIEHCGKEIAKHTQVLGVVLNKCRFVDSSDDYTKADARS
jgi:protein-tyrosine kinase